MCVCLRVHVQVEHIQRPLSVSVSQVGELDLMSCLLPEEVLVDILTERFQVSSLCGCTACTGANMLA